MMLLHPHPLLPMLPHPQFVAVKSLMLVTSVCFYGLSYAGNKKGFAFWRNIVGILQEYCLVTLDVFRRFPYAKEKSEQTAWLSLLAVEDLENTEKLIQEYPWLEEIYKEIAMLRQNPEKMLNMFSEALRILDRNTIHYMIEELQKEVEEEKKKHINTIPKPLKTSDYPFVFNGLIE